MLNTETIELPSFFDTESFMKVRRISSEEELKVLEKSMSEVGFRLACISNTGLKAPQLRVTFLPDSAFLKEGEVQKPSPRTLDVRDLVTFMDAGHSSEAAAEMARDKFEFEHPKDKFSFDVV